MKKRQSRILFVLTLVSLAGLARGFQQGAPMRDRVRENIGNLRLLKLTQALDLTEEQAAKLYPALSRIEKEKLEIQKKIGPEIKDLRNLLREEGAKEGEIIAKVNKIKALRAEIRDKDEEAEALLEANLTTIQKGKYLIFSVDFFQRMGENLRRVRSAQEKFKRN